MQSVDLYRNIADVAEPHDVTVDAAVRAADANTVQDELAAVFQVKTVFKRNAVLFQQRHVFRDFVGIVFVKASEHFGKRGFHAAVKVKQHRQPAGTALGNAGSGIVHPVIGINEGKIAVAAGIKRFLVAVAVTADEIVSAFFLQQPHIFRRPPKNQRGKNRKYRIPQFRRGKKHVGKQAAVHFFAFSS